MKIFEKMKVGTGYGHVTDAELACAKEVHGRYISFLMELYGGEYGSDREHTPLSLTEFLLQDTGYQHLDSFMWDKGVLVKTKTDRLGLTVGWTPIAPASRVFAVNVQTARGVDYFFPDSLEKAEIPPEVLDYVKSTLHVRVHVKVDEAFKEN